MYNMTANGGLNRMDEAGITWIRHNDTNPGPETNALIWTAVEPNKGDRKWSTMAELETQLINASSIGKKVLLIVRSTPLWAHDTRWPEFLLRTDRCQPLPGFCQIYARCCQTLQCPPVQRKTLGDYIMNPVIQSRKE